MKKPILFKRTRKSVIRKIIKSLYKRKSWIFWMHIFNIRYMLYTISFKRNK